MATLIQILAPIITTAQTRFQEDMIQPNVKTKTVVTNNLDQAVVVIKILDRWKEDYVIGEAAISACLHIDLKTITKSSAWLMEKEINIVVFH